MLFVPSYVDDALKGSFEEFRQDPLNNFRVHVRRVRAAQLRRLLADTAAIDLSTFQREVWSFEAETCLHRHGPDIPLLIFGKTSLLQSTVEQVLHKKQVTLAELEVALTSGDLELHGNYIWFQGAHLFAPRLKNDQKKLQHIHTALQILNDATMLPLQKAKELKNVYGFGENNATGLVMIFHPDEFPLINPVSRGTLKKLGFNITASTPLDVIQEELLALKEALGAEDFLELDWFMYLYNEDKPKPKWVSAVKDVLEENGTSMRVSEITEQVLQRDIPTNGKTPERTVSWVLTTHPDIFERVSDGEYQLKPSLPGGKVITLDPPDKPKRYIEPPFEEIYQAITNQGLQIDERTLRRYHLSLKARGFVILSGHSGTGKTWLTEAYCNAVEASYLLVPVAPNWTTNEDLLGYVDPLNHNIYRHTPFSYFLESAAQEYELARDEGRTPRPFHLVLDEMNLARVEYYFAKFLSAMEVRARQDVAIIDLGARKEINLYRNLYFVGTINVDETTHGFADKVYDRAQLIEMTISRDVLETYLKDALYRELLMKIWDVMHVVAPFAFRVLTEIAVYVKECEKLGISWQEALDEQIVQKILPKCKGINPKVGVVLNQLRALLPENEFSLSHQKVQYMLKGFELHGIASYF